MDNRNNFCHEPENTIIDLCCPFALMFLKNDNVVWIFCESHEKARSIAEEHNITKYAIIRKTDFLT